jgi:multiple sugar transport system ATP-binding protein
VQVVEPTGAETQVFAELAGTQITAVFTERHEFQPGDQIMLRPRPETIHLFDAESGRHL